MRRTCASQLASLALIPLLATACSENDDAAPSAEPRPDGPAADVSQELTGGNGPFVGAASGLGAPMNYGFKVPSGYAAHEYVAAGTASDYVANGTLTRDGMWTLEQSTTASYRTRVIVLTPADAAAASGTAVMEWLNVSGGLDANPEYASVEDELVRQRHTWVGVSAQLIGVEGGPVLVAAPGGEELAGKGLKKIDPARYGTLSHPGDGYSFDIFTQVARALRSGSLLRGSKPRFVIAAGESQSAIALVTYYNGVQPLTRAFDGFFVHSRGGTMLPLVAPGAAADLVGGITNPLPAVFRGDLKAPVMDVQAEGDLTGVLNSSAARQDDGDQFRLWEVAGTAHADVHLVGALASSVDCGVPINSGPLYLVANSALRALDTWVRTGTSPVVAPRLEMNAAGSEIARDADGIALGGIRTPPVDVPVDVLSGAPGPNMVVLCLLLGSTTPLPDARLAQLYPNRALYEQRYAAATGQTIEAGYVLEADRDALVGFSQPGRVQP